MLWSRFVAWLLSLLTTAKMAMTVQLHCCLSIQTTSWKSSFLCATAHSRSFCLLMSRISWQYADPRCVHPRNLCPLSTVCLDIDIPNPCSLTVISHAVVSSSFCTVNSITSKTPRVNFVGLPLLGKGEIEPCFW